MNAPWPILLLQPPAYRFIALVGLVWTAQLADLLIHAALEFSKPAGTAH